MCHIRGKRTRYRQYTLDGEETALFMKYYNVPIIEINNVKQKLVGESIDWAKGVVVTLYEEVGANFDTHGTVSVMVARAYEYYLKEQFELQMFPFGNLSRIRPLALAHRVCVCRLPGPVP